MSEKGWFPSDVFRIEANVFTSGGSETRLVVKLELRCNEPSHDNEIIPSNPSLSQIIDIAEKHWRMHETAKD